MAAENGVESKKFTLRIGGDLDFRLGAIARNRGVSKAALALRLIEQGIERYGLDAELKAVYARIVGAGETA
jgi:predicted DNA-binding protein